MVQGRDAWTCSRHVVTVRGQVRGDSQHAEDSEEKRQRSWVLDDIAETLKEPTLIVKGN